jgi:hypothetical protein
MKEEIEAFQKEFNQKLEALQKKDDIEALKKEFNQKLEALQKKYESNIKEFSWVKYENSEEDPWIKHPTNVFRVKKTDISRNGTYLYPHYDVWNVVGSANHHIGYFREATNEEITKHLVFEALARGYKKGLRVWSMNETFANVIEGDTFQNYHNDFDSFYMCRTLIYEKGKWAKIYEPDEKIMIDHYEVKFTHQLPTRTTIDGFVFDKEFWEAAKIISQNSKAKIMIGCSKQFDVSLEIIESILNRLNK